MRTSILILACTVIGFLPPAAYFTFKYQQVKVRILDQMQFFFVNCCQKTFSMHIFSRDSVKKVPVLIKQRNNVFIGRDIAKSFGNNFQRQCFIII